MKLKLIAVWNSIYYAVMLLRLGGFKAFFRQLMRQIYSRATQISFKLNLQDTDIPSVEARIKYSLQLASKEDMDEVFQKAKKEKKHSVRSLVFRKWLYEDGYHNCYIARTLDTGDLCFMAFTIYPEDDKKVKGRFRGWFPKLKEDEVLLEGAYTFDKYRGNRLQPAVTTDQLRICKKQGFKWAIVLVAEENAKSLKGTDRAGFIPYGEVPEIRLFFLTWRKFKQRVNL